MNIKDEPLSRLEVVPESKRPKGCPLPRVIYFARGTQGWGGGGLGGGLLEVIAMHKIVNRKRTLYEAMLLRVSMTFS